MGSPRAACPCVHHNTPNNRSRSFGHTTTRISRIVPRVRRPQDDMKTEESFCCARRKHRHGTRLPVLLRGILNCDGKWTPGDVQPLRSAGGAVRFLRGCSPPPCCKNCMLDAATISSRTFSASPSLGAVDEKAKTPWRLLLCGRITPSCRPKLGMRPQSALFGFSSAHCLAPRMHASEKLEDPQDCHCKQPASFG